MEKRYFEFHGADAKRGTASSSKFWEVWAQGSTLFTRFGKIGASGQTTVKDFSSAEKAGEALEKKTKEKIKNGYEEKTSPSLGITNRELEAAGTTFQLEDVSAAQAAYKQWAERYKPVFYLNMELEELPPGIGNEHVWTEGRFDMEVCLTPGFIPANPLSNYGHGGYMICSEPTGQNVEPQYVLTEMWRNCLTCDSEGYLEESECPDCDAQGEICVDVSEEISEVIYFYSLADFDDFLARWSGKLTSSTTSQTDDKAGNFEESRAAPSGADEIISDETLANPEISAKNQLRVEELRRAYRDWKTTFGIEKEYDLENLEDAMKAPSNKIWSNLRLDDEEILFPGFIESDWDEGAVANGWVQTAKSWSGEAKKGPLTFIWFPCNRCDQRGWVGGEICTSCLADCSIGFDLTLD